MAVEHWYDPSFGRAKPRLEIVFDADLNHFEVNGKPGRLANIQENDRPTIKNTDVRILLEHLVERQGNPIPSKEQFSVIEGSIPDTSNHSPKYVRTRMNNARDVLLYRLRHEDRSIVSFRAGAHSSREIGIIHFNVSLSYKGEKGKDGR